MPKRLLFGYRLCALSPTQTHARIHVRKVQHALRCTSWIQFFHPTNCRRHSILHIDIRSGGKVYFRICPSLTINPRAGHFWKRPFWTIPSHFAVGPTQQHLDRERERAANGMAWRRKANSATGFCAALFPLVETRFSTKLAEETRTENV